VVGTYLTRIEPTASRRCPHCGAVGVVKHGLDDNGQQRFRCRPPLGCTFNALTGTPLARMRKPEIWLAYAEALGERSPGFTRIWASRA